MTVMYLGPDIKGVVRHNQIFTYQPADVIERAGKVHPLTEAFFVEMEHVVEKKKELRREGSFLNLAFTKILKQEVDHGRV
jgi:hypothetical protein